MFKHVFKMGASISEAVIEKSVPLVTNVFEYNIEKTTTNAFNRMFAKNGAIDQKRVICMPKYPIDDTGFATKKINPLLSIRSIIAFSREGVGDPWGKESFDLMLCDGYSVSRAVKKNIPNSRIGAANADTDLRLGSTDANARYDMYRDYDDGGIDGGFIKSLDFRRNVIVVRDNTIQVNMTALGDWKDLAFKTTFDRHGFEATHASLKFEGLITLE